MEKFKLILVLIMFTLTTGCGAKNVAVNNYDLIADTTGLKVDEGQKPGVVLVRPGAPGLEEYDRFIIDPVQIIYTDHRMKELSTQQVARMQQYLQDAVIKQLIEGGYEVGTKSTTGTMRITFTISGLRAPSAAANVSVALVPIAVSVGEVTIEAVFREAVSNRIDGVAVSQSRGSRMLNASPWSTWADVERTFDNWAKAFRDSVDKAHWK
jgi:F420-dependent methylenetetrahydromethanopterin dehydrogenase